MSDEQAVQNVERLIGLTEQLTAQLGLDAAAFEARRPHEAAARMEETSRLANLYRYETARVQENPGLIADAPAELGARLRRASETFEKALRRHGRALYAVKTVTEGVVKAIADEVVRARAAGMAYGPGARSPVADATAVTLNRRA